MLSEDEPLHSEPPHSAGILQTKRKVNNIVIFHMSATPASVALVLLNCLLLFLIHWKMKLLLASDDEKYLYFFQKYACSN